jgi:hypothetical protein
MEQKGMGRGAGAGAACADERLGKRKILELFRSATA